MESKKHTKGIFRLGTSNIVLPGAKSTFPKAFQDKTRLEYYSSLFNSLEVNSTFYKIPKSTTFEKWTTEVPEDFRFTIKLSRDITHSQDFAYDPAYIDMFMKATEKLGTKKGCLLVQFPPSVKIATMPSVNRLLDQIRQYDPHHTWRIAVEFRHRSWYEDKVYAWLDENKVSVVLHDMPASKTMRLNDKAECVYIRFHGPKGDYKGSYDPEFLNEQAEMIRLWLNKGLDVYVYFNNTTGNAFDNACYLKEMIEQ